jgi:drug/metabolite transporter (DMT)-like permease
MIAGALCMSLYNVWSRPFVSRSGAIPFAAFGMGVGAACLVILSLVSGGLAQLATLAAPQWLAGAYLAVACGAVVFFLWAFALGKTTPTLVAITIAVNPVTASIFGLVVLDEAISASLIVGLIAVLLGILVASTPPAAARKR